MQILAATGLALSRAVLLQYCNSELALFISHCGNNTHLAITLFAVSNKSPRVAVGAGCWQDRLLPHHAAAGDAQGAHRRHHHDYHHHFTAGDACLFKLIN